LTVDNQGNIYVGDLALSQIQVFRHDGQPFYALDPRTIKGANFGPPSGIWVDAGYCLYAVDSESNHVGLFQIRGNATDRLSLVALEQFVGTLFSPCT